MVHCYLGKVCHQWTRTVLSDDSMNQKFHIAHCFLRLFSQFEIKSLSIAVFSMRKCCDGSLKVKNATLLCLAYSSHIFNIFFPQLARVYVLGYYRNRVEPWVENNRKFLKFSRKWSRKIQNIKVILKFNWH